MPQSPKPKISPRQVDRFETLFEKLQSLARQVETAARSRPGGAVPDDMRVKAEALLYEVLPFREARYARELPLAAPHFSGLSAQLAEALTALVTFETRHSQWDARFDEPVWSTTGRFIQRLRRLAPRPGSKAAIRAAAQAEMEEAKRAADMIEIRRKLVQRLVQSERELPPSLLAQQVEREENNLSPGPRIR